jgi:superoxide dismutase, Fe-Mn family
MRAARFATAAAVPAWTRAYTALPSLVKDAKSGAALPELSFDWREGCKPVFTARQMELHYTKHHKAYVDKLNTLATDAKFAGKPIEEVAMMALEAKDQGMFNQAAQHFNHTFYWHSICPNGKAMPKVLEDELAKSFGSVGAFKKAFEAKGMANFGSGWTWLVVDPASNGALKIHNTSNAGFPISDGLRPVFTADVWEHAYYKDFENKRADYLAELWQVVNWEFVAEQLTAARK